MTTNHLKESFSDHCSKSSLYATESTVKKISIQKGQQRERELSGNKILFLLEGTLSIQRQAEHLVTKNRGEFVFIDTGTDLLYKAIEDCIIMVIPIHNSLSLYRGESIEALYTSKNKIGLLKRIDEGIISLKMNEIMWDFVLGINNAIEFNLLCREYVEIKVQEFFILLRGGYSKEQLRDFFQTALSPDTAFSEFVKANWLQYNTVNSLSDAMNLSVQHFTKKFKLVFGIAPGQWIMQEKALCILKEIQEENKTFQQIAFDYGFSAVSNFNRFCKIMLSKTPSEIRNKSKVLIKG